MELTPGTEIDRYRVEGELGRGGMAVVYRVRHLRLGTLHALKVVTLPTGALRDRLLAEGNAQARLDHPNVVAVRDVIDVGASQGLVMEFVRGPTLERLLEDGALPHPWVAALVPGILAGVAVAHAAGLVHRDLKPSNVLLATARGGVQPKVADFGLVKLLDQAGAGRTRSGVAMGTPSYMAPEQIRDARNVDRRADVFALGALLYELVAGARAFDGDSTPEVFEAILEGRYAPLPATVPSAWVSTIERALRRDPRERPEDGQALWASWGGPLPEAGEVATDPSLVAAVERLVPPDPPPVAASTVSFAAPSATPAPWAQAPAAPRRRWWVPAAMLGFGSAMVLTLAVLVPMALWRTVPAPAPVVVTAPAPVPVAAPAPLPAAPLAPLPVVRPRPVEVAAPATFTVDGGDEVWLIGPDGARVAPGPVPAGTYTLQVLFGGQRTDQGRVVLEPGQVARWTCTAALRNCIPVP